MSEAVSQERCQILAALGAEFLRTPAKLGTDGAIEAVYRLNRREPGSISFPINTIILLIRWLTITEQLSKSGSKQKHNYSLCGHPWELPVLNGNKPTPERAE